MNDNETRTSILAAARNIFAQSGYQETSITAISNAAQVPQRALAAIFPSKQRIFTTLMDEFASKLERRLTRAIAQEGSGVARAAAAIASGLAVFAQQRTITKIFLVQAVGISASLEQHRLYLHERFVRIIQSYLEQAIQEGEIAALDTQIAATLWMGAIHELVLRWVQTESFDLVAATPTVQAMLLRSVGVSETQIATLQATPPQC